MRRSSGVSLVLAVLATLIVPIPSAAQGPTSPPGAPTGVTASAGTLSAIVSWTPAGSPADSFTVISSPGGISATVSGTPTRATVTGLGFLASYTFSVTGHNALGTGPASAQSNAIAPDPPGGQYHQGFAVRLLNQNITAGKPVATNLGDDPVHLPGLSAVVVNLTASQSTASTVVQVVVNQQVVQTIPVASGQVESSLAVIAVPAQLTQAAIQVTTGTAHVQLDFVGYFTGPKRVRDHSGMLEMIAPATLLDASVATGSTTNVPVLGQGDVPAAGVSNVLLNVTATGATGAGAVTLRPSGAFATGVTTLGFAAGQTTANRAIVAVPTNGAVAVVDTGAAATVHVDVLGWFTDGSDKTALGSLYTAVSPTRLLDTSTQGGPVPAGGSVNVVVWGHGGAPAAISTAPPTSALFEITAVAPAGPGSISVSGATMIAFAAGQTVSGTVLAHLAGDGSVLVKVSGSAANVTVDLLAYFSGDLIVPGSTKALSPALLAGITSMGADLSITFAPGTQVSPPVQLNDVINAGISPTTPKGFLRRVLSITTLAGGAVVLGTRYALLSEALTAFVVDWVATPTGGSFGAYANGPRSMMATSAPIASANQFPPPPLTSIDPNYPLLALATPTRPIAASIGAGAEVSLTDIEVQVLPHVHLEYNFFTTTVKAAFAFSEGVRLAVDFTITRDLTAVNFTVPGTDVTIPLGAEIPIPIGPIVVVITPVLVFAVTVDASISVGLSIGYRFDKFIQVTESYDGSQFHTSQLAKLYADGITPPEASANADLKVASHTSPGIEFYDLPFFSALVDISRYMKYSASVTCSAIPLPPTCGPAAPWWTVSTGICLGVAMNLDLILIKKFFSQDFLCIDVVIAHAPGLRLDVQIVPTSATVSRFQVQHFHAAVTNSPGGVTWSVPGGSASGTISNTNLSDADYTAPGRAGQYKVRATANDDPTSFREAVITVPPAAPSSPSGVLAGLTGPTSLDVAWNPPADDGGVALTGYQVTSSPGGIVVGVGATTHVASFTGLTPGTAYTFTATATNSAGLTSAPSAPSAPVTIPNPIPDQVIVTPQNTDFGLVAAGQSVTQTLTVHASSTADITITSLLLQTGLGLPLDFAIPASTDACTGTTVPAGGTCTFQVVYAAAAEGYSFVVVYVYYNTPTAVVSAFLHGHAPLPVVSGFNSVTDAQILDLQHGWAMDGARSMWATADGTTWTKQVAPAGASFQYNFRFADALHGLALGCAATGPGACTGFDTAILGTSDGGATWTTLSSIPSLESRGIWFDKDGIHAWAIGADINSNAAVYASGDGGLTWGRQTLPDPEASSCIAAGNFLSSDISSVRFIDHLNGWAFGSSECQQSGNLMVLSQLTLAWSTADGGATWTAHDTGLNTFFIFPGSRLQVLSPASFRIALQVGTAPPAILATDDGGVTFRQIPLPDTARDLSYLDSNNAVLMTGTNGRTTTVWTSTNDGITWTQTPTLLPGLIRTLSNNVVDFYNLLETVDATHWWAFGRIAYLDGSPVAGVIVASADASTSWRTQLVGDLTP